MRYTIEDLNEIHDFLSQPLSQRDYNFNMYMLFEKCYRYANIIALERYWEKLRDCRIS